MHSPGSVLADRYQLEESLGSGDLGEVYRAVDLADSSIVAVKVLKENFAEDPEFVRRFRRNMAAISRLDHPSIVRVYGFAKYGPLAFVVMDYVPGESLRRRLVDAGGPLPFAETGQILDQVASALDYAHRQGVTHGDLKPSNILLPSDTRAVVCDFGLVAAVQEAAVTAMPAGSPAYMSPEQFEGRQVGAETDIYSLGVVLYEMVTGQRPFRGESGAGITARERLEDEHLNYSPSDPQLINGRIPAAASSVILRALAKMPRERWQKAREMASAWTIASGLAAGNAQAYAEGVPADTPLGAGHSPGTTPDQPDAEAMKGRARAAPNISRPWAIGGILLVGLAAVAVLAAWLLLGRSTGQDPVLAAGFPWMSTRAQGTNHATTDQTPATLFGPMATLTATVQAGRSSPYFWPGQGPKWTPPPLPSVPASSAGATAGATTQAPASDLQADVQANANIRSGPGTGFEIVGGAGPGTRLGITGRNGTGEWLQICCVTGERTGWIFASLVNANGDLTAVPVVNSESLASPSATMVPPETPTIMPDTPTPPAPIAEATTVPATAPVAACPRPPEGAFANLPGGQDTAGCAVGGSNVTHFSHQYFEHGQMIYRNDVLSIYVLYDDGSWSVYRDTYIEGQPWQARSFDPPAGLEQPIKGFDRIWERPEVRGKLGWATRDEMGVIPGQAEDFQRGTGLWLDSQGYLTRYFVLFADLAWRQF